MATLLQSSDSLPRHLEVVRRHMRKCSKTPGASSFGETIKPIYEKLKAIKGKLNAEQEEIQDCYDDIELFDTLLDDTVRELFGMITISDRNSASMPLLPKIFSGGTFGYIVDSPVEAEIDEVNKIIDRLKEADTEGKFSEYIGKLTAGIESVQEAMDALKTKMNAFKSVKSETEILKSELRWQYEVNYLDARKKFGRKRAELLFPKKNSRTKNATEDSGDE